jgi:putative ABC transport system permease protein
MISIAATNRWLPLRLALRELRGGFRGFYVFIACIALGVMAIAGVGSVSASLVEGLAREGRVILGGDVSFNLIMREASADEHAFLASRGTMSAIATMRSMARTNDGRSALVEMKAVDAAYPLFGNMVLDPPQALDAALAQRDGAFGAVADPTLLTRLNIKPGARLTIGDASFEIRAGGCRSSRASKAGSAAAPKTPSRAARAAASGWAGANATVPNSG